MSTAAKKHWWNKWSTKKEVRKLEDKLETLTPEDDNYAKYSTALKDMKEDRRRGLETAVKVLGVAATSAVSIIVAKKSLDIDRSNEIPDNPQTGKGLKTVLDMFTKNLRF